MAPSRIEKLEAQRDKLARRIKLEKARVREERRKRDTRRKILLGALTLHLLSEDDELKARVLKAADRFFDKPADRKLFGLATKSGENKSGSKKKKKRPVASPEDTEVE